MAFVERTSTDPLRAAFMSHVKIAPNGCWVWIGNMFKARGGYGCFTCRPCGVVAERAHRSAWKIFVDPYIIPSEFVLHKCDNPRCVNPDHLFIGDHDDNMRDMLSKRRNVQGSSHGMSKLKESDVIAIRADNRLQAAIAADYGVSVVTISDIKRRRSWAHL